MIDTDQQLKLAGELTEALQELTKAEASVVEWSRHRDEILQSLRDATKDVPAAPKQAKTATKAKAEPDFQPPKTNTDKIKQELAELEADGSNDPLPGQLTDAELAEQAKLKQPTEAEAYATMAADIDLRSDAQMRMIFGLLNNFKPVETDEDRKAVIHGIIKDMHHGETFESTKELSKTWAGDIITYLQNATDKDVTKFLEPFYG